MKTESVCTCPVCIENFNRSNHLPITCIACGYVACRACYQVFLLQHPVAKCMNCPKELTRRDLVQNFTQRFVNQDYKVHRERLLFEKEKAMLPATQSIVEELNRQEKIREQIAHIKLEIQIRQNEIRLLTDTITSDSLTKERKVFIRKCPNADCRGFLSTQWKCNLCSRRTCKDCNECIAVDDEDHKCNPDNLETAKLLSKDSKPCPNCGEIIFKIDGCDQIFCTLCHTAFSWNTGRIETGPIHNPHYFEWIKRTNQELNRDMVVLCGREIDDHWFIRRVFDETGSEYMLAICRHIIHFRQNVLPRFTVHPFEDNQGLRIAYLRKEIDEKSFKTTLQQRDKARHKKEEYFRLFAMMIQCVTDILYRFVDTIEKHRDVPLKTLKNRRDTARRNLKRFHHEEKFQHEEAAHVHDRSGHSYKIPAIPAIAEHLKIQRDLSKQLEDAIADVELFSNWVMHIELDYIKEIDALTDYVNECLAQISTIYNTKQYSFDKLLNFMWYK